MTTWRHTPKGVRAWNVEALARGTPSAVKQTPEVRHVVSRSEISHVAIPEDVRARTNSEGA